MRRLSFFSAFLVVYFLPAFLLAQAWVRQAPFEVLSQLNDIVMDEDGYGWAIGKDKTALYTDNFGEVWQLGAIDIQVYNDDLLKVVMVPGSQGMIAIVSTNDQKLYRTEDGGETWDLNLSDVGFVEGFQVLNDQVIYAFGEDVYKTVDGGLNWEMYDLPDSLAYSTMGFFVSEQEGWVVEYTLDGVVLKTTDGGLSWQKVTEDVFTFVEAIHFVDDQTGFLITKGEGLFKTVDGGQTWTLFHQPTSGTFNDMHIYDANRIVLIFNYGDYEYTENGGTDWETFSGNSSTNVYACTGLPDGRFWVVGKYTTVYFKDDFSTADTWDDQVGGNKSHLGHISFIDENHGFSMGDEALLRTQNGGAIWEDITGNLSAFQQGTWKAMYVEAPSNVWMVNYSGQVIFSDDYGDSWVLLDSIGNGFYLKLIRTQGQSFILLTQSGEVWKSVNNGYDWELQQLLPGSPYTDVEFSTSSDGWICGHSGELYHSIDGGSTWEQVDLGGTDKNFSSLAFVNEQLGFLAGRYSPQDSLWVTEDGGQTWEASASLPMAYVFDIEFANEAYGWAVGGVSGSGQIAATTDGGETWTLTAIGEAEIFSGLACPVESELAWACGPGGSIVKWVTCESELPVVNDVLYETETFCIGDTVTLAMVYENVDIFNWDLPDDWYIIGNDNSAQVSVVVGVDVGSIVVSGMNTCGDEDTFSTEVLTPNLPPDPPVLSFDPNAMLLFTDAQADSYVWIVNGQVISGENGAELTPQINGIYSAIALSDDGCASAVSESIEVIWVGSLTANVATIRVFPNPVRDEFTLSDLPKGKDLTLKLYGIHGQILKQYRLTANVATPLTLSLPENCPSGLYYLQLQVEGQFYLSKFNVVR